MTNPKAPALTLEIHQEVPSFATFLRELADFYEEHPEVPEPYGLTGEISVFLFGVENSREILRSIGSFDKNYTDNFFMATKIIGGRTLKFTFDRDKVCTPRVVGKKIEPAHVVPAEFTPEQFIPEREIDIIEWDCDPILGPEKDVPAKPETEEIPF